MTTIASSSGPVLATGATWQWIAALAICLLAAIGDRMRAVSSVIDIDDTLRRLQIEDLLADNHWFDRTLPFVSLETPYVSPWSRLVDAPYVLITRALEPFLGTEAALDVACLVWPPLLLVPLVLLLYGAARKLLGRDLKPIELGVFAVFLMQAAVEFAPGRIDHHNVQMVLLALFVRGLIMDDPLCSGLVAGSAAMLSLSVGLETVPMLAVGMAGAAIAGALGAEAAQRRMAAAGGAMLALAPLGGLALVGPGEMQQVHCDALSAPWISAAMGGGLLLLMAPAGWRALPGNVAPMARLATLAGAGLLLMATLAAVFPSCTAGPLQMIDPVTRAFWFDNVAQEQSGLTLVTDEARRAFAVLICLSISAVILAGWELIRHRTNDDGQRLMAWLVVLAGIMMAILAVRYVRISFLLTALIVPLAAAALTAARDSRSARKAPATAAVAGAAAFLLAGISPAGLPADLQASHRHLLGASCPGEDAAALHSLPPGVVMAPFGLSPVIMESGAGHRLSAIPFHRSAPGIRQMAEAFTSPETGTVRSALRGIDYVAVCAVAAPIPMDDLPLYRDLTHRVARRGLEHVAPDTASRLLIYRVRPEDL